MSSLESRELPYSDIAVAINVSALNFDGKRYVDDCMASMRQLLMRQGYTVQGLRYDLESPHRTLPKKSHIWIQHQKIR
jgi:hypothetical protein